MHLPSRVLLAPKRADPEVRPSRHGPPWLSEMRSFPRDKHRRQRPLARETGPTRRTNCLNEAATCIGPRMSVNGMVRPCSCPASAKLAKGRQSKEHAMSETAHSRSGRSRRRYRQELISCCGLRSARCDRPASEVVAWPGGRTLCQPKVVHRRELTLCAMANQRTWLRHEAHLAE